MLLSRLQGLRERLDLLREGRVGRAGWLERAWARLGREEQLPPLEVLLRLDRELDRVGIHTAADARLLRTLGDSTGRAGALAAGLSSRAVSALDEFEDRLRRAERALLAGQPLRGAATLLDRLFPALGRAVKVAALFAGQEGRFEVFSRGEASVPAGSPQLEIARFWAERARTNTQDLLRKRRDLDAAHELLLRIGSGLRREGLHALRLQVSDARQRAHQSAPVRSLEDLVRHVRIAARKEPRAAYQSLRALYERAVEAGDSRLAQAAHQAVSAVLPGRLGPWLDRAENEALGILEPLPPEEAGAESLLAGVAFELDDSRLEVFELAAGVSRYFDVEDSLKEAVVEAQVREQKPAARRVPYPTQRMSFEVTGGLHEVNNFVLSDPRMLVYDLASNRQLVRSYLEDEPPRAPKRIKRTAVRVYVCDASGSMYGPRARFRDSILISELNNLRQKAQRGEPFDPLYFCFFNDRPSTLARVDTAAEASRQIEKLFAQSPAEGQTQITGALVSAFDAIRAAAGSDPYLSRATVVLVTDGEDRVDLELIRATRSPVGALDISLSFISLGEENPDLRSLAHEQRSLGGRAFYHHLSDAEIGSARTAFDSQLRTLLPREVPLSAALLERLLPHLDALEQLARELPPPQPSQDAGFDAIFPPPPPEVAAGKPKEDPELAELLEAICEACSLAPPEQRATESTVLLHHLLGLYRVPLADYLQRVTAPPPGARLQLQRLRRVCRPFG